MPLPAGSSTSTRLGRARTAGRFGSTTNVGTESSTTSSNPAAGYTTSDVPTTMSTSAARVISIAGSISGTASPKNTMNGRS